MNQPASARYSKFIAPSILGALAAVLMLWGLSAKYLWQDEAQTAVLAQRLMRYGRPLAYDGVNLITIDQIVMEDAATIGERTGDPKAAVDYYIRRGDLKPDSTWRWQPWGQFLVEGISLKLFGATTLAARLPFALAGIVTVLLLYQFVLTRFDSPLMAWLAALLLVLQQLLDSAQPASPLLFAVEPATGADADGLRALAVGRTLGRCRIRRRGLVLVSGGLRNAVAGACWFCSSTLSSPSGVNRGGLFWLAWRSPRPWLRLSITSSCGGAPRSRWEAGAIAFRSICST